MMNAVGSAAKRGTLPCAGDPIRIPQRLRASDCRSALSRRAGAAGRERESVKSAVPLIVMLFACAAPADAAGQTRPPQGAPRPAPTAAPPPPAGATFLGRVPS